MLCSRCTLQHCKFCRAEKQCYFWQTLVAVSAMCSVVPLGFDCFFKQRSSAHRQCVAAEFPVLCLRCVVFWLMNGAVCLVDGEPDLF